MDIFKLGLEDIDFVLLKSDDGGRTFEFDFIVISEIFTDIFKLGSEDIDLVILESDGGSKFEFDFIVSINGFYIENEDDWQILYNFDLD